MRQRKAEDLQGMEVLVRLDKEDIQDLLGLLGKANFHQHLEGMEQPKGLDWPDTQVELVELQVQEEAFQDLELEDTNCSEVVDRDSGALDCSHWGPFHNCYQHRNSNDCRRVYFLQRDC